MKGFIAELYAPGSFLLASYEPRQRLPRMAPPSLRLAAVSDVQADQLAALFSSLPKGRGR